MREDKGERMEGERKGEEEGEKRKRDEGDEVGSERDEVNLCYRNYFCSMYKTKLMFF